MSNRDAQLLVGAAAVGRCGARWGEGRAEVVEVGGLDRGTNWRPRARNHLLRELRAISPGHSICGLGRGLRAISPDHSVCGLGRGGSLYRCDTDVGKPAPRGSSYDEGGGVVPRMMTWEAMW